MLREAWSHQDAGRPVYIVTAAGQEIAEALARVLVFDGGIGMRSEIRDGVYTGRPGGPFTYREGKVAAIEELAEREGFDLAECYAYSDSESDLPMLRAVGNPVAVNPDATLAAVARKEGWRVIRFDKLGRRLRVAGALGALALVGGTGGYMAGRRRRTPPATPSFLALALGLRLPVQHQGADEAREGPGRRHGPHDVPRDPWALELLTDCGEVGPAGLERVGELVVERNVQRHRHHEHHRPEPGTDQDPGGGARRPGVSLEEIRRHGDGARAEEGGEEHRVDDRLVHVVHRLDEGPVGRAGEARHHRARPGVEEPRDQAHQNRRAYIGQAISLVHRDPAREWTVAALADETAMSRSAFAARFTDLVGEPAMQYVTRWRMHVARDALEAEGATVAELAGRLGYRSEAAFARAFKRVTGVPPGAVKRRAAVDLEALLAQ